MKKSMIFTIVMTLPFMSQGFWPFGQSNKEGIGADSGKHFAEPASENIAAGLNSVADSLDNAAETMDELARDAMAQQIMLLGAAVVIGGTAYAIHSAGWYAYHAANGTLEAELAKHKAEAEEAYQRA